MEIIEIKTFIKNNSKILTSSVKYTDDGYSIYEYTINALGVNYTIQFIENDENEITAMKYNSMEINGTNNIQLELYELMNYKNIEYIDCYIIKKSHNKSFEILDVYDDCYNNNEDMLVCNRTFIKDNKKIHMKIVYQYDDYTLYYNMEVICGFDNIIKKIDEIL